MDAPLNVVVVEDHDALREVTVQALCDMGCVATGAACAEEVVDKAGAHADLFVIDLNLPGEDGISLARRIRAAQPNAGIIMVTVRQQLEEKVAGYESGADLYLTKPTSIAELGAAVQALGRRLRREGLERRPAFVLDTAAMVLNGPASPSAGIRLSAHEVIMLAALARASERRLEYWQLMELAGKFDVEVSKRTLEVQIVRLRKKLLDAGAEGQPIQALRGVGYQLCIPVTIA